MNKIYRLHKRMFFCILASFLFLASCGGVSGEETSQPAAVDDMIKAFSTGCNIGEWTHAALDRSASVVAVYESLRQKASCKDDSDLLDNAIHTSLALQAELRAMTQDASIARERRMDDASNDLLITIKNFDSSGAPVDASLRDSLLSYYSSARYEQALAKADVNYLQNPTYKSKFTYGMVRVNEHMRNLLAVSDKLSLCYSKNPSVAVELGANIAELVGTFASPAVGLGVSALSKLLQFGVVASRSMPPAESIYHTNKNKMPTALQCGLEALSRDYCKAKDAALLASLSRKDEKKETSPFFVGVEVLDRYLPSLNSWLDRVVNGSDVSSDPDLANKINFQFDRYNRAGAMKRLADSYVIDTKKRIFNATTTEDKVAQIRLGLKYLIGTYFSYTNGGDPFSPETGPFAGFETARSFLLKLIAPKGLAHPNQSFSSVYDQISDANLDQGDWPVIVSNMERMYKSRYDEIINEFNEKVNVNISGLVRDASTYSKDEEVSPLQALQRVFYFFDHYSYDKCNAARDHIIITQLRERIQKVYSQLLNSNSVNDEPQEIPCPPGSKELATNKKCFDLSPAKKTIVLTFEAFKLDKNNVFLPGAMSKLVNTDLTSRYLKGEGPKDIDELYRLAGSDMDLLFKRMKLTPALVRADTDSARQISSDNLKEFRNRFLPSIRMAMEDLKKSADEAKEPAPGGINTPFRNVLSRLCILTLITGTEWPKDLDPELCADAVITSDEAKLTISYKELKNKLEGKSFADRVCAYEEFLRFDRLANAEFKNPRDIGRNEETCASEFNGFSETNPVGLVEQKRDASFWQRLLLKR